MANIREKYEEIMENYMETNDVGFQEYAGHIRAEDLTGLSMLDIVELYGALSNSYNRDIVKRVNTEDEIHEVFGKEIVGKYFVEDKFVPSEEECPF